MCVCGVCYVLVIYHRLAIHWLLWLLWSITWSWNMSVHKFCGSCRRYQGLHVRTTQEVFLAVHRHATGMHTCILSCITNSIDKGVCLRASHCCHVLTKTSTSTWFQNITKIMCCSLPLPKPNIRLLVRLWQSDFLGSCIARAIPTDYPETAWYTNIRRLSERGGLRLSYF